VHDSAAEDTGKKTGLNERTGQNSCWQEVVENNIQIKVGHRKLRVNSSKVN